VSVTRVSQISGKPARSFAAGAPMKKSLLLVALLCLAAPAHAIDERYPAYAPRPELAGEVEVRGAPAPANLLILWGESFRGAQPGVTTKEGAGGTRVRVAIEALAVLVHKDNPLACLSLDEVKALYAANAGWGAAGATGAFASEPVQPLMREEGLGEAAFFREAVLGGAALPANMARYPRASRLLKALAETPGGVAFLPAGYRGEGVKALQLSDRGSCAAPTQANASRAEYPLSRFVYLEGKTEAVSLAFFDYVLSAEGQRDAVIAGHFSLPFVFAREERAKLRLD
jgi:phosphate transport system substrate-binding protein